MGPPGHGLSGGAYAYELAMHFGKRGLLRHGLAARDPDSNGAANTLAALKRRGLARNDGGGCFLSNRWEATEAGHELAGELRQAAKDALGKIVNGNLPGTPAPTKGDTNG